MTEDQLKEYYARNNANPNIQWRVKPRFDRDYIHAKPWRPYSFIIELIIIGICPKTTYVYEPGSSDWMGSWTLFFWAFWLAWGPFVGVFLARISRGRTLREFVIAVFKLWDF